MDGARVDLPSLAWREMAPGARHKVAERAGKRLRILEHTPASASRGRSGSGPETG